MNRSIGSALARQRALHLHLAADRGGFDLQHLDLGGDLRGNLRLGAAAEVLARTAAIQPGVETLQTRQR